MIDYIKDQITKTRNRYKVDYAQMLRDYRQELETAKGYNGRQLLELLQNCDDQRSKKVRIELNEQKGIIAVHNDGIPFSEKGYRSLFVPNLSSKTSQRNYIGNKGLGFRSIITWSTSVEIQSKNISLLYSKSLKRENFNSLFSAGERENILEEENLAKTILPIPFLTLPKLTKIKQEKYVTSIIIHYEKKYLKDIKKQISSITPETILFLKHLEDIEFKGCEGTEDISCKRSMLNRSDDQLNPVAKVRFQRSSWSIFKEEAPLPADLSTSDRNEREYYQIMIAVDKDFRRSSEFLFSFFPTKIRLGQPYILHATFDLDSTRNQINDSEKNRFILEKVAAFTTQVAKYYAQWEVSYIPLILLNHEHEADTLYELGYYDLIQNAIDKEPIFPCIDNTYKTKEESLFVSTSFAELMDTLSANDEIGFHLIPPKKIDESFIEGLGVDSDLDFIDEIEVILNGIAKKTISYRQRALFVAEILGQLVSVPKDIPNSFSILVNEDNEIVNGKDFIYTPVTGSKQLKLPSFAKIQFINKKLFDELLEILEFTSSSEKDKGRFIANRLNGYCNVYSYEPATVARKIISESISVVNDSPEQGASHVKEMIQCLFHNYQLFDDKTRLPDSIQVLILNSNEQVAKASDLVLPDAYPSGKRSKFVFGNYYSKNDFVASPELLGLDPQDDIHVFERFLIWLGVNRFARHQTVKNKSTGLEGYVNKVLTEHGVFNYTSYNIGFGTVYGIEELLDALTVERLIAWICLDHNLKDALDDSENKDDFSYYYRTNHKIYEKASFLKYCITKRVNFNFQDYLIDDKFSWVNETFVNYNDQIFKDLSISKSEINEILIKLGANDDFLNLSIERVAEILNLLPLKFPTGTKSQTVYKKALNHYREHGEILEDDLELFADNGTELAVFPQSEVYFSDKIKLPKRLYQDFPLFNFPSRAGGNEAIEFFQINNLKDIRIEIVSIDEHPSLTLEFKEYLDQLKPLILAHRINEIDQVDLQRTNASICNQLTIKLCTSLNFQVNSREYQLEDYEYIHKEDYTYYIKINSFDSVDVIRRNKLFIQSFVDVVSLSFDVFGNKNEYRYMLRSSIEDVKHGVILDFGEDNYLESRNLLGLADHKQSFWEAVFLSKGIQHEENLDDLTLTRKLEDVLDLKMDISQIDFENLNMESEILKVQGLFETLVISLADFNSYYTGELSLVNRHLDLLKNEILKLKPSLKVALWFDLRDKDIERQEEYLNLIQSMEWESFKTFAFREAVNNKHSFDIDVESIALTYVKEVYGELDFSKSIDLDLERKNIQNKFSQEELNEIYGHTNWKSLLYFKSAIPELKKRVQTAFHQDSLEGDGDSLTNGKLVLTDENLIPKPRTDKDNQNPKKVYSPSKKDIQKRKVKGDEVEDLVYAYMKDNGFEGLDQISRDNEGLHCDIRYTDVDGRVKYVEVKSFDKGYFHLSRSEYDFGESVKEDYEIWLVKNKSELLPPITDFFDNPKYKESLMVNEYKVHLKIDDNVSPPLFQQV